MAVWGIFGFGLALGGVRVADALSVVGLGCAGLLWASVGWLLLRAA